MEMSVEHELRTALQHVRFNKPRRRWRVVSQFTLRSEDAVFCPEYRTVLGFWRGVPKAWLDFGLVFRTAEAAKSWIETAQAPRDIDMTAACSARKPSNYNDQYRKHGARYVDIVTPQWVASRAP